MEFLNSLKQVSKNWGPYQKWEKEQDDKDYQRQALAKKVKSSPEELEQASQYGRTIIEAVNTMDQYSVNKAEDVELASLNLVGLANTVSAFAGIGLTAALFKFVKLEKIIKNPKRAKAANLIISIAPAILVPLITTPLFMIKAKTYEKEASRVARFQAREKELKDPRNFVIYNEQQTEEAKEIAKTLPTPPDEKKKSLNPITGYSDSIKSIKELVKDHDSYLQWKAKHIKEEKERRAHLDELNPNPEEMDTAKRDQDNLSRAIRKIELYSQNYLANAEAAIKIAVGLDIVTGALFGAAASGIIWALQKAKMLKPNSEMINSIRRFAPILGPVPLLLATSFYSIKAQKEAAKIGRYKAKQELLNDPHNFINYTDEQKESVKDLKAPEKPKEGIITQVKNSIKFFFEFIKDYKAYEHDQKTTVKERKKLDEALTKVKISDKQMQDAKSLQKNAFRSFEKIDEMTQRYSDDTEAATNIAMQTFSSISPLISMAPLAFLMNSKVSKSKNLFWLIAISPAILITLSQVGMEIAAAQIRKKAGRIGVMEATQDLQDPRLFINKEEKAAA